MFKSIIYALAVAPTTSANGDKLPSGVISASQLLSEKEKRKLKDVTKIVVVGGGAGGLSVASQLEHKFKSKGDIVIVEPSEKHYYQPLWTLVGGGIFSRKDSERNEKDFIPKGATWIKDSVTIFKPEENIVLTKDGKEIDYDYLVVSTGLELYWDKVKGLKENLGKNGVTSNYSYDSCEKTFEFIKSLKPGNVAIFTVPTTGVKCGGAPQKILWLCDDYLRKHGIREQVKLDFNSAGASMFPVKKYSEVLDKMAKERGVNQNFAHNLVEIKGDSKEAVFETPQGTKTVKYDMLHVVPPMGPYSFIKNSPLADPVTGFVNVNKETLQHVKYDNVFSLGDTSNLPTSKTAAAITSQAPVLVGNLINHKLGLPLNHKYDGYTSCPITTSYSKIILAEFKYGFEVSESLPFDQSKESYFPMFLKKYVFPTAYWEGMLKGRWFGKNTLFNPVKTPEIN
ncbi:hypothetical protein ACTA71_007675 [Dictyostelium dimigraforme]